MTEEIVYAGIDIGGTNIKFGLFNASGKILLKEKRPTLAEKGPTPLMHRITNIGEHLLYLAAEENYSVNHIGIGSPGAVNHRTGNVIGPCPNLKGWEGIEIGKILKERLNIPIWVDNDVNAMALAESRFGAARGAKTVVCVTIGTGIGGGVIIDGKVYHGSTTSASELGHMTINYNGDKCSCGNFGCLEVYCSSQAMIERTKHKLNKEITQTFKDILECNLENLTIKKLFAALKKGDNTAVEVINETAVFLGIGLAGIVNLLNPEVVVIGGGVIDGGGGFLEAVSDEIKKRAFSSFVKDLKVTKAALGNDAGFIGAGLLGEIT
ncbi:MAG: ROK family protein [Candidatus Zixiibacteriota bacterium]